MNPIPRIIANCAIISKKFKINIIIAAIIKDAANAAVRPLIIFPKSPLE
jgi:hypothetical protein